MPRSRFVTWLAWIFIIGTGFFTFTSLVTNIKINTRPPDERLRAEREKHPMSPVAELMSRHVRLVFGAQFVFYATAFASSIGLLKRKNWARVIFIGVMGVGIVWSVGRVVPLVSAMLQGPPPEPPGFSAPPEYGEIQAARTRIRIQLSLPQIVKIALFAWIIVRLTSVPLRSEFGRPRPTGGAPPSAR